MTASYRPGSISTGRIGTEIFATIATTIAMIGREYVAGTVVDLGALAAPVRSHEALDLLHQE